MEGELPGASECAAPWALCARRGLCFDRRVSDTLVLGYGNCLRRDDGAGPEVARRVEALALPGVEVIEAHQLLPEHAEALSRARRAIFVDASVDEGLEEVRVRELRPSSDPSLAPHASDPESLLSLAALLFERAPEAWLVEIPASDLGIGEGLSEAAGRCCGEAFELVRELIAASV